MAFYKLLEFNVQEKMNKYFVYQGSEEIEVELNEGYTNARDLLEYIHFSYSHHLPVSLFIHYHQERLNYILQSDDEHLIDQLRYWMPNCCWEKMDEIVDVSFAQEKIVLRGSVTPLVLKEREHNLLDELVLAIPKSTFLIQMKLGVLDPEQVKVQIGLLEQTINELGEKASIQVGEQSAIGQHLKKMLVGGENLSFEQKNISVTKQVDILENHLYSLNSQGAVFGNTEFVVYAGKQIGSLIASKMEAFSRRSGSLSLYRLRRDPVSPVEFLNYASAYHLAALIALPLVPVPGIKRNKKIIFEADPGYSSNKDMVLGNLVTTFETQVPVSLPLSSMTRHAFISGVTGSGKTSTIKSLLIQAYEQKIPFLVIEPAKTEYRYLDAAIPLLRRYVLGIEGDMSFKMNPFEFPEHIHVQTHLDHLKSVFIAAFPMYGPMPYILETAFYSIYRNTGWDFLSGRNIYESRLNREYLFPTLEDLYSAIDQAIASVGYSRDLSSDIRGALKVRIGSLLSGAKGSMLNCRQGHSIQSVLQTPSVFELEYVGDDEEKVFLMGLLLISIYEHYVSVGQHSPVLKHLLVIEEAHRLLQNIKSSNSQESADMKGKAVETFNNMLSEIRTYGQGFVIADQIPNKLSPDVIKNTNLKVIHRMFAKDDRQLLGDSIGLQEEEQEELIRLKQGEAIIYHGELDSPVKVKIHVDGQTLASNRLFEDRLTFKSFSPEDYLLQQEAFLSKCYRLMNTGLLFPSAKKEAISRIALQAQTSYLIDWLTVDEKAWWSKVSERYLKSNGTAERIPYVELFKLLTEIRESDDPLGCLYDRMPEVVLTSRVVHPMSRYSAIYKKYLKLNYIFPIQLEQMLVFISSQPKRLDGDSSHMVSQLLKHAGYHQFLELELLNQNQKHQLCSAILLTELPDQMDLLESFFNVQDLSPGLSSLKI